MANICAESDVSSPSAVRTDATSFVVAAMTWSLPAAAPVPVVITLPVTASAALIETQ